MSNFPRCAVTLAVSFLVFGLLTAGTARAEDTALAREHYQKGTGFFDLGKYPEAIKEFEAAYEAKNDPAFLYNLAQAHRLAGNAEQALRFYRTYLRKNPKAPNRADIEDKIAQLEKLVDQKTATQNSPPTQTIQPSLPGTSTPPGFQPAPPAPPPATPEPPPSTAPPVATTPPATPAPTLTATPPPVEKQGSPGLRIAAYALGGGAAVAIVVGAIFGKGAQDAAKEIKAAADTNMMYTPALESVDSRGQRDQTLEFTFIGLGAAALAGGIVCYILSNGSESPSAAPGPHLSFHPSVGPNAGAAALRVSF